MAKKTQSPCIGVCKFRRPGPTGAHCIGCSMTKVQKKMFKSLKKNEQRDAFIALLTDQQTAMGKYGAWGPAYVARARKKGARTPLSLLTGS